MIPDLKLRETVNSLLNQWVREMNPAKWENIQIHAFVVRAFVVRAFVVRAFVVRAFVVRAFVVRAFVVRTSIMFDSISEIDIELDRLFKTEPGLEDLIDWWWWWEQRKLLLCKAILGRSEIPNTNNRSEAYNRSMYIGGMVGLNLPQAVQFAYYEAVSLRVMNQGTTLT